MSAISWNTDIKLTHIAEISDGRQFLIKPARVFSERATGNSVQTLIYVDIQWRISQTQRNFIMFNIVLGQHVSILIQSSSGPSKKQIFI